MGDHAQETLDGRALLHFARFTVAVAVPVRVRDLDRNILEPCLLLNPLELQPVPRPLLLFDPVPVGKESRVYIWVLA